VGPEDPFQVAQAVEFIRALHVLLRKMTSDLAWLNATVLALAEPAGMCRCKRPRCAATSRNQKFLGFWGITGRRCRPCGHWSPLPIARTTAGTPASGGIGSTLNPCLKRRTPTAAI